MRVTVVGLGLIGGSVAMDLRATGMAGALVGVDANAENGRVALGLGLVDRVATLEEAIPVSDLVVLAIPVDAIAVTLPRVLLLASDSTTVTDMGSTKERICRAVKGHPRRAQFVASHPMAGTEHSGPTAALQGLFAGKVAVICDGDESAPEHRARVEALYATLKMRLITMSSSEHDLHAAYISHLSHISSFVLANTVLAKEKNVKAIFDLASGGFESTVRLAKSSPAMWVPIFEQNLEHVTDALDSYIQHLQEFQRSLVEHRFDTTRKLMRDANEIRRVLANIGGSKPQ